MSKKVSKNDLCKMYGLSYKTLAKRLASVADLIAYTTKAAFDEKDMEVIKECLGDPSVINFTKKQLKELTGVDYKTLKTWFVPQVFTEREWKEKRYFTPKEVESIAGHWGLKPDQIRQPEKPEKPEKPAESPMSKQEQERLHEKFFPKQED